MRRLAPFLALLASACPTVDLGDQPPPPGACRPDRAMFEDEVWPMALAPADQALSCVTVNCHAKSTGRSALRLNEDPQTAAEWQENYDVTIRFLNCGTPQASALITKPASGGNPHGGGDLWTIGQPPETVVEDWIVTAP